MAYRSPLMPYVRVDAESPDLPVRGPDDPGEPDHVARASVEAERERGVRLAGTTRTGRPVQIAVDVVAPGIVHVLLEGETPDPERVTLAHDLPDQPVDVSLERSDDQVMLTSESIAVQIRLDPFHLTFFGPDGRELLDQNYTERDAPGFLTVLPFGYTAIEGQRVAFHDTFNVQPDEHFYGFGEKFTDFDKRGQRLEMWVYDPYGVHTERAYKPVPFFISSRGYAIFVDSVSCVHFDMAKSNHSTFNLVAPDTALDYYVIAAPEPKALIKRYASLVSFPILPPKWAFGLWTSSGFRRDTQEQVLERASKLRAHDIPCDVLHLDCFWQRHGAWSDMAWNEERFPDPAGLIEKIKQLGFKVSLWMNPYIGIESERFAEAEEKGYLLKNPQGQTYVLNLWGMDDEDCHPPVGIVDMTHPEAREWFGDLLRPPLRIGADVFKTDFGEGVPVDAVAHNGMTGETLHNLYPLLYNDLVAEITAEETEHEGMVWGRSTYAGGQRHAAQWGGDAVATYQGMASTLRGGLSIGMCGHAFWSHDIGGFHLAPTHRPSPELYARWAQFGLFSPLSRAHGVDPSLPWEYGETALRIFRKYARLRYRLLPYIYTYACVAAETSLPLMRAMVLEFPDDPHTYTMDLQYLFGREFLVAPIYNQQGKRPVYLPAGRWVDFWSHDVITGPETRHVEAHLDVMPLYVRANSLVPTIEPPTYLTEAPFEMVTFDAYLLDGGRGSFDLRDTDGVTHVSAALDGSRLDVHVDGVKEQIGLRLLPLGDAPQVKSVHVNGEPLNKVDALEIMPDADAGWARDRDGTLWALIPTF